jgi:hypothetical protein
MESNFAGVFGGIPYVFLVCYLFVRVLPAESSVSAQGDRFRGGRGPVEDGRRNQAALAEADSTKELTATHPSRGRVI